MTKNNTVLGLDLFDIELKDFCIFHIPHASTSLPDLDGYNKDLINNEIIKLTDWATDEIFDIPNTSKVVANFSRIYCDIERFSDDEKEPMSKLGRGFYYTKTDNNSDLRKLNKKHKQYVYDNFYKPHHDKLNDIVYDKLMLFNTAIIIDCHSFSNTPFESDLIKEENRPDICIGVDEFHTPKYLVERFVNHFSKLGYSVQINNPYSGTIVNSNSYLKNKDVQSIMIEINRKLYMDNDNVNYDKVKTLNEQIQKLFI